MRDAVRCVGIAETLSLLCSIGDTGRTLVSKFHLQLVPKNDASWGSGRTGSADPGTTFQTLTVHSRDHMHRSIPRCHNLCIYRYRQRHRVPAQLSPKTIYSSLTSHRQCCVPSPQLRHFVTRTRGTLCIVYISTFSLVHIPSSLSPGNYVDDIQPGSLFKHVKYVSLQKR